MEEVSTFHPTFTTDSDTLRVNELLIEGFLKEGSNPWFCPSFFEGLCEYLYCVVILAMRGT